MHEKKPFTHMAYTSKRDGRSTSLWLAIGTARIEVDESAGHHIYIDRLPVGGFSGHIYLSPLGILPPEPQAEPLRPGHPIESEEV